MPDTTHSLAARVATWAPQPVADGDPLGAGPVAAFSAVLDQPEPAAGAGEPLPPLWQWLYFLEWPGQRALGADGHPADGRFLPPIPHRQRMIAGGRCEIHRPLLLGTAAERIRSLVAVVPRRGASGELLFVTVRSEFRQQGELCLVEEQDVVYRSGRYRPGKGAGASAAAGYGTGRQHPVEPEAAGPRSDAPWQLSLRPDPPLLFRVSALTANAHRIHYDHPYATGEEGYPGLVVHGPLLALAMLELVRRNVPRRPLRSVAYRLHRPAFAGEPLLACGAPAGGGAELHVASAREQCHATAEVAFDRPANAPPPAG